MKRLLSLSLMAFAIFTLVACGKNDIMPNIQNTHEIDLSANDGSAEPEPPVLSVIGDIINFGGIDWRVLDVQDGVTLVISQYILELRAFHDTQESITWEHSDIRQYLNNDFFYSRFTDNERSRIAQTTIINHDNPWFGTDGGNDTNDRIFLLSLDELVRYFGDSGELANHRYDWAWGFDDEYNVARIAYTASNVTFSEWVNLRPGDSFSWWLRSPGTINDKSGTGYGHIGNSYVVGGSGNEDEEGIVDVTGVYVTYENGIRPALWISP